MLCTIHQPSAVLFEYFDQLLLLASGGNTLYFGEVGGSSKTFINYFEQNGARPCEADENPAEWVLDVTGAAPGSHCTQDWASIWKESAERKAIKAEFARLRETLSEQPSKETDPDALHPFGTSFLTQMRVVLPRAFLQHWRTPTYLYSKLGLCLLSVSLPVLSSLGTL